MTDESSETWNQLMAAAQSGDRWSYARLLQEILPTIRLIAQRYHERPDHAEAVVRDVLATLHRVRHTYDPGRSFANWLCAITHRRSREAAGRKAR